MLARSWCVSPMLNYDAPPIDTGILPPSKTIAFTDFLGKCWSQGRPSRLFPDVVLWWASPTGERLPPGESLQVLLSVAWRTDPAKNFTLTGPFYSREKSRSWSHGVMVAALEFISWCEFISFSCRDQLTLVIFAVKKLGDSTDPSQRRDPFDFFPDFDEAMSIHRVMSNGFFSPLLILPMAIHQVSSAKGDDLCGLPWFLIYYVSQHSDFLSTTVWSGKMRCIFNMFFPFI